MRRALAALLLGIFGFTPVAPALFASDPDSKLPPCCRRNGQHHCALASGPVDGPVVQTGICAAFPIESGVPAQRNVTLPAVSEAVFAELAAHPATRAQTLALLHIAASRAAQKRGPPLQFS